MSDFKDIGFTVLRSTLNDTQCALLYDHWRYSPDYGEVDTPKDIWKNDRLLFDIATEEGIVSAVRQLLEDEVYLWGASFRFRTTGQIHKMHCDAETLHAPGFATVWIGLRGTDKGSALGLIPGSHHFGRSVQDELHASDAPLDANNSASVAALAKKFKQDAQVETPDLSDGDALIFDGRIWHGSDNTTEQDRLAILLQYARHDLTVRQKVKGPTTVPQKFEPALPTVFPIGCNVDALTNPVALAPPNGLYSDNVLGSEFRQLDLPLADDSKNGWKPYIIARGATPNAGSMSVHASTLAPGKSPHPPHNHLDEEILLVLEGQADIVVCDDPSGENAEVHVMKPGGIAIYPPYQYHTIVNRSDAAVNYLMFRWSGKTSGSCRSLNQIFHNFSFHDKDVARKKGNFRAKRIFKDPTHFLEALECHVTNLDPGGGYDMHSDEHDVAIIVFEGEIEIGGQRAGRGGVFYIAAGTPHDMTNPGQDTARYLVFEFHTGMPVLGRQADKGGRRARKSRKWKGLALKESVQSLIRAAKKGLSR